MAAEGAESWRQDAMVEVLGAKGALRMTREIFDFADMGRSSTAPLRRKRNESKDPPLHCL